MRARASPTRGGADAGQTWVDTGLPFSATSFRIWATPRMMELAAGQIIIRTPRAVILALAWYRQLRLRSQRQVIMHLNGAVEYRMRTGATATNSTAAAVQLALDAESESRRYEASMTSGWSPPAGSPIGSTSGDERSTVGGIDTAWRGAAGETPWCWSAEEGVTVLDEVPWGHSQRVAEIRDRQVPYLYDDEALEELRLELTCRQAWSAANGRFECSVVAYVARAYGMGWQETASFADSPILLVSAIMEAASAGSPSTMQSMGYASNEGQAVAAARADALLCTGHTAMWTVQ